MGKEDRDYFRRRAEQELEAVREARDSAAADVHKTLAIRYAMLADGPAASQAPGEAALPE